jgi:hypothetical protein
MFNLNNDFSRFVMFVIKISLTALTIAACVATFFAVGCTSNKQYRTDFTPCDPAQSGAACAHADIESTPAYKLGYVEFDDQGWYWDPKQVTTVEQMIRTEAGIGQPNNQQGIVIVVFVHGWKNNAATNIAVSERRRTGADQPRRAENRGCLCRVARVVRKMGTGQGTEFLGA